MRYAALAGLARIAFVGDDLAGGERYLQAIRSMSDVAPIQHQGDFVALAYSAGIGYYGRYPNTRNLMRRAGEIAPRHEEIPRLKRVYKDLLEKVNPGPSLPRVCWLVEMESQLLLRGSGLCLCRRFSAAAPAGGFYRASRSAHQAKLKGQNDPALHSTVPHFAGGKRQFGQMLGAGPFKEGMR